MNARLHPDLAFWICLIFLAGFVYAAALLLPGCSSPPRPSEPEARSSLGAFERGLAAAERECGRSTSTSNTRAACERPVIAARDGIRQATRDPSYANLACAAAAVRWGLGSFDAAMLADGLVPPVATRAAVAGSWPLAEHASCYPESPTSTRSHVEDSRTPRVDPKPPNW